VIAGEDLAVHHNKYGSMWKDKSQRKTRDDWSAVPRNYFTNYKVNMIRDSHMTPQTGNKVEMNENKFKSYTKGGSRSCVKSK